MTAKYKDLYEEKYAISWQNVIIIIIIIIIIFPIIKIAYLPISPFCLCEFESSTGMGLF